MKMILLRVRGLLTRELTGGTKVAIGLLILSVLCNAACAAALMDAKAELQQAEQIQFQALEQLAEIAFQVERDRRDLAAQAAAYETVEAYRYIGECTITSYCPCKECCGQWADGLTATGIPAGAGIVAVDPEVIPLGSTVIINGFRYLAADTGVTGLAVDICTNSHQEAEAFGMQTATVWIETAGEDNR